MRFLQVLSDVFIKIKHSIKHRLGPLLSRWHARWQKLPPDDIRYTFRSRTYPGSRMRRYLVHVPPGSSERGPLPLVMVLHGCRQDNQDIERISGFNEVADQHGFLVAYPFVTTYRGLRITNCWGWWFDREIHRGAGEVEDLWQIIEEIKTHHPVDKQRIHVSGLSSGAGMIIAMMVAHSDKIASGASVAGIPYTERPEAIRHAFNRSPRNKPVQAVVSAMRAELNENPRTIPLQIIHSENDETVDIQSAKNLRDSWAQCFGVDLGHTLNTREGRVGTTHWRHTQYKNSDKESVLETYFMNGPGHGWYGGKPGDFSFPQAPDVSRLIWAFFDKNRLQK